MNILEQSRYTQVDVLRGLIRTIERVTTHACPKTMDPRIWDVPGMIDPRFRHFLHHIAWKACYVEVGTLFGASVAAASYGNEGKYYTIDDFSYCPRVEDLWPNTKDGHIVIPPLGNLRGERREYVNSLNEVLGHPFALREGDGATMEVDFVEEIDIFYYDADHSFEGTQVGIAHFMPQWAPTSLLIVDDWNSGEVVHGTQAALAEYPGKVVFDGRLEWWNGMYIALLERENG